MIETKFKHTDIGLVPEDWEVKSINDLLHICNGRDYKHLKTGTVPVYGTGGIIQYVNSYLYDGETVCIGRKGTIDKPLYHNGKIWTVDTLFYTDCFKGILPRFLYYLFCTINWRSYNEATGVPSLSQEIIGNIKVQVPTIHEQQRIASALMKVDALISNLDKLIAKKQAIKKGAMQELLTGKKRLPGFKGDWKEIRLGDVAKVLRGGSPRPIEEYLTTNPNGINWIKIGDVSTDAKYIEKTEEKIKPSGVGSSRCVHVGDLILSNSMSYGRPYILKIDGCIHDGWLVIQDYQLTYDVDFLYYTLGSDEVLNQYIAAAAGSSVKNLNKDKVSDVLLTTPVDIEEQRAIAHVLSTMDSDISLLQKKREKYQQIKQGMMRDLLTGRIRLLDNGDMGKKLDGTRYESYTVGLHKDPLDGAIAAEPHPD